MDLDDADMPESLARLVEDMEAIGAGQQVVHASLKVRPSPVQHINEL